MNSFRTGLFENPYVEPAASAALVGNPDFMQAGYEAQVKSVVMVKNHGQALPQIPGQAGNDGKKKVFVPERYFPQTPGMFGLSMGAPGHWDYPVDKALVEKYFDWAVEPEEADFALVVIEEPKAGSGYDVNDRKKGGNGYVPISLQYRPYKAEYARKESIAGGDPKEDFTNRSYRGKTVTTYNEKDLDLVIQTRRQMRHKPVVVVVNVSRPVVLSELEPYADAILLTFGVQNQAVLDIISGAAEPNGLLPMQFPADMRTVEEQQEDVPHDMRPLVDADGNVWDFAYGLNWSGAINDARTAKYRK
jgi:beta-glucosidase